jgi:hypothetical protein
MRADCTTATLFVLATGVSSVGLSGSTVRPIHRATAVTVKQPR